MGQDRGRTHRPDLSHRDHPALLGRGWSSPLPERRPRVQGRSQRSSQPRAQRGPANAYRGNKSFGIVAEEPREYGSCDFEVDEETDRVEPRPAVRGDAARVYFYMEWMYGLTISEGQRRLLMHWHQTDPVDAAEVALDVAIEERQGNSNPFVR